MSAYEWYLAAEEERRWLEALWSVPVIEEPEEFVLW